MSSIKGATPHSPERDCAARSRYLFPVLAAGLGALFLAPGYGRAAARFDQTYAGSTTCQTCHEDIYNNLLKSPHGIADKGTAAGPKGDWKDHACEACHGPGAAHASSADPTQIRYPPKQASAAVNELCLSCHQGADTNAGRFIHSHARQGVSCIACHSIHGENGRALIVHSNQEVNALCSSCHLNVWASFQKPYGHRLTFNSMSCVDCHNQHGSSRKAMQRVYLANEAPCFACHADKRGPFAFDHQVVRTEGCAACHEPHGSINPRALIQHEVRLVCLECHANLPAPNARNSALGVVPPSFHDLRSPIYQNCTVCHQRVHGSYTDRFLIR